MAKIITRDARPDDLMFKEGLMTHSLPLVQKLPQSKSDTAGHPARASETGSKKGQDPSTRKPTRLNGGPVGR
jgi:hypothetical protein